MVSFASEFYPNNPSMVAIMYHHRIRLRYYSHHLLCLFPGNKPSGPRSRCHTVRTTVQWEGKGKDRSYRKIIHTARLTGTCTCTVVVKFLHDSRLLEEGRLATSSDAGATLHLLSSLALKLALAGCLAVRNSPFLLFHRQLQVVRLAGCRVPVSFFYTGGVATNVPYIRGVL